MSLATRCRARCLLEAFEAGQAIWRSATGCAACTCLGRPRSWLEIRWKDPQKQIGALRERLLGKDP